MAKEKNSKFAVIKTGGKQYKVSEGDIMTVEKVEVEDGKTIDFGDVLLVADGDKLEVGQPNVKDIKVKAKVIAQEKADKLVIFKYKKRKNYRVKTGHRQKLTKVQIEKIGK